MENIKCIKCGGKTQKFGKVKTNQRFKCNECDKTFTDITLKKENERKEKYESIKKMYLDDGLSTTEIGEMMGVSSTVPQRILKKMGITRTISDSKKGKKIGRRAPVAKIVELYLNGTSTTKISEKIGFTKTTVLNILNECGIERNNVYIYEHPEQDSIKESYLKGNSIIQVSNELKVPYTTVYSVLNKLNIIRKDNRFHLGYSYDVYLENLPVHLKYKSDVMKITNKQKIKKLDNYNKRGISGIPGAYHLDHKFSILEGFKQGVEPEIIGNIKNLEFIPWEDNLSKGSNCSITLNELYTLVKS